MWLPRGAPLGAHLEENPQERILLRENPSDAFGPLESQECPRKFFGAGGAHLTAADHRSGQCEIPKTDRDKT